MMRGRRRRACRPDAHRASGTVTNRITYHVSSNNDAVKLIGVADVAGGPAARRSGLDRCLLPAANGADHEHRGIDDDTAKRAGPAAAGIDGDHHHQDAGIPGAMTADGVGSAMFLEATRINEQRE